MHRKEKAKEEPGIWHPGSSFEYMVPLHLLCMKPASIGAYMGSSLLFGTGAGALCFRSVIFQEGAADAVLLITQDLVQDHVLGSF